MASSERFVCLIRRIDGIFAVFSTFSEDTAVLAPIKLVPSYHFVDKPLTSVSLKICPQKNIVLNAWNALAEVRVMDPRVLANCLTVLIETQSDDIVTDDKYDLALFAAVPEPKTARPTAAHPRAFKGTKTKLPKNAVEVLNLQTILCTARGTNALLDKLEQFREPCMDQLLMSGYKSEIINRLEKARPLTMIFERANFRAFDLSKPLKLSGAFQTYFLPLLRESLWPEIAEYSELEQAFDFRNNQVLLAAIARLACLKPAGGLLSWFKLIGEQSPEFRLPLLTTILVTHAYKLSADTVAGYMKELESVCADQELLFDCLKVLLQAIDEGHYDRYVMDGFYIKSLYSSDCRIESIQKSSKTFNREVATQIDLDILQQIERPYLNSFRLWQMSADNSKLDQMLQSLLQCKLPPNLAIELIYFGDFSYSLGGDSAKLRAAKSELLARYYLRLLEVLSSVPSDFQDRCLAEIRDYFYYPDTAQYIEKNIDDFLILLKRICTSPFNSQHRLLATICGYTEITNFDTIISAPDSCLLILESETKNENMQHLTRISLMELSQAQASFVNRCLLSYTTKLCKCARVFGTLSLDQKRRVLEKFGQHPLMQKIDDLALPELWTLIAPVVSPDIVSPFPAKLSGYMRGEIVLSPEQLRRAQAIALEKLDDTRLDLLRAIAFEQLGKNIPSDYKSSNANHAVQLLNLARHNRRAFKSFVRNHWQGKDDYRLSHYLSRRWLAKHPKLNIEIFIKGIVLTEEVEGLGEISLSVEQDPLEVIKLGSYAHSCLGLGGIMGDSSLAVVLDVNKCVVYARNLKGKIVGRQILAWNEADQLVCFEIYPLNSGKPLKRLFANYDRKFAAALDCTIYVDDYQNDVETPEIINILSCCWWDDGSWDLSKLDEDEDSKNESTVLYADM